MQEQIDARLREIGKTARLKGFRPGRVPLSVVRQRYGKQARQEVMGEAIQNSVQRAIAEQKLRPASMPRLDAAPRDLDGGDLEFDAIIEVYPDIDDIDAKKLKIDRPDAEVTDADVEEMLKTLREQRRTWEEVERAAGIRAIVITGSGKAFVAGADIAAMREMSAVDGEAFSQLGHRVLASLEASMEQLLAALASQP